MYLPKRGVKEVHQKCFEPCKKTKPNLYYCIRYEWIFKF